MIFFVGAYCVRPFYFSENTYSWEQRKLGEITISFSGGTPIVGNKEYYNGKIPFIRSGEINSDKTELFISQSGLENSSAKLIKKGDILYALYGATSGEVGRSKIDGAINQAILAIIPDEKNDPEFIAQWLRKHKSSIIQTYLQGGQGNLSGEIVKNLMIIKPKSSEEQTAIGNFFKQLDETIALHQRQTEKYQKLKQGFLQSIFQTEKHQISLKNTNAWEQRKLGEIVHFYSGLTYSPNNVVENGTLVLRSSNVQENQIVTDDSVFVDPNVVNSDNVQLGDIIVVVRNGSKNLIGKHARIQSVMSNTVIGAFMTGIRSPNPEFLSALLDTQKFNDEIDKNLGATINQITTGNFKQMEFSFPSEEEQTAIGNFFKQLDETIALHQRQIEKYRLIKKLFLEKMFIK